MRCAETLPGDLPAHARVLGTAGIALLVTGDAGPDDLLARTLFWITKQTKYL